MAQIRVPHPHRANPSLRSVKKYKNLFTAEDAKDAEGIYIHRFHRHRSSVYLCVLCVLCGEGFFHTSLAQDGEGGVSGTS